MLPAGRSRATDASPSAFANPAHGPPFGHPRAGPQGGLTSLVATARGQTPDPIPNSAVKTLSADGTASQDVEEQVAARLAKPPPPPRSKSPQSSRDRPQTPGRRSG